MLPSSLEIPPNRIHNPILSVCIRVHPWFSFSFRHVFSLVQEPELSHFFAAGAAHFASETGIGSRLAKAGYTATRIEE
jgi:hypothetical protein